MPRYPRFIKVKKRNTKMGTKKKSSRSTRTPPFKSLIATGVKTLSSFIPGQTIVKPAVDFLLKTFGFVKFFLTETGELDTATMISGAATSIPIYAGDLFSELNFIGLPRRVGVHIIDASGNAKDTVNVIGTEVNHKSVQVLHTNFKVIPTGEFGKRCGMWAIAWQPNQNPNDDSSYGVRSLKVRPPSFDCVREMTFSRCGPATKPLTLNWKPQVARDGHAALPKPIEGYGYNPAIGWLFVSYENDNRPANTAFSLEELSFEIVIKSTGRFGLKEMNSSSSIGGQILKPTLYEAKELSVLLNDGSEDHEFDVVYDKSGNLKCVLPLTKRYQDIKEKLCAEALDKMAI